jgi:hypothetical protein
MLRKFHSVDGSYDRSNHQRRLSEIIVISERDLSSELYALPLIETVSSLDYIPQEFKVKCVVFDTKFAREGDRILLI